MRSKVNDVHPIRTPLERRTFLRGLGVAIGLPMLDVMLSRRATAATLQEATPRRVVAIQTNQGIMPHLFFPEQAGKDYELSPYLKLLEPLRNDFTVFSGVSHVDVDGGHQNDQCFLTGAPHPTGASFRNSVSFDQIVAEKVGSKTRLPYLAVQVCNGGNRSMSYTRSGVMIPSESDPAVVYRQLFVQGTPEAVEARVKDLQSGRSLLDFVRDRARRIERSVSKTDQQRLDQYFTSIRELEQQLHELEAWERKPKPKVDYPEPQVNKEPAALMTRLKTMLDIVRLALETDSTRVISLFIQPLGTLAIDGVRSETHSLTHHGNRPEMIEELRKIEETQFGILRDFLLALRNTPESNERLLDRTSVIYGTNMGNANGHSNTNWPMMLIGGGYRHGQHLAFDKQRNAPLANLFVSVMQRMGLEVDAFATSTGTITGLDFA